MEEFLKDILEILDDIDTAITEQKYHLVLEDSKELREHIYNKMVIKNLANEVQTTARS